PLNGGFVGGLRPWDFPSGRHPSYAASIYYRFRTFTLRIHGYLQASHNATERGIRGPVIGRKNHYGSKSKRGTEVASIFYSLIETAKLHDLNPAEYLRDAVLAARSGEPLLPTSA
ncbi:MAG: hypothetical protein AAGF12_09105, partial [Myxococcota bacterium]